MRRSTAGGTGTDALELAPLRGFRYAGPDARAFIDSGPFDLALALSPPYDQVGAEDYAQMTRVEPHNAARLTLPPSYQGAARTLRRWIDEGVLVRDRLPALYPYEQTTPDGLRQRGLIGALRLPPAGAAAVRPHEDTAEGPVRDRARLMAATRANLEPIMLLYRGAGGTASRTADAPAEAGDPPLVEAATSDGVLHRLWAVTDPAVHAAVAADLAERTALIADGHHRYAAYRRLQADHPAPGPWDHGLALLVDSDSSPPRIGAIHRVLRGLRAREAAHAAEPFARAEPLPPGPPEAAVQRLRTAAEHGPALIAADAEDRFLLHRFSPDALEAAAPDRSAEWRALPTAALERLLLPAWKTAEDTVELVHDDPAAALAAAGDPARPGTAVLLPPMRLEDVYRVTARGELTPRKSTSFGPKPRTGLVLRSLD
ncbi:DUF1015 domain-containing protein [Nocardiopsis composta]|uniref:Uncharacterized protein (DUF1015 family) n=1 Tax=Nocardiopsis composta TaxID=157465 RepID=A0A7W8QKJ8_9ACTN|nr:DUF1015 domain-containing protein [Nocardiopsis composta]MBB5431914.1 uncharacterized protein (DUF1015 family) [Nocardiopsis composta]